jgi:hypothetical protein
LVGLFLIFAAAASAVAFFLFFTVFFVDFGFNKSKNLAAGGAFELVDLINVALVDIYGLAASGAFKLETFAAIAAIAIIVAIVAITVIVIVTIAAVAIVVAAIAVIVAAIEILFYCAEILVDLLDIIAESCVFVLEILNRKCEVFEKISHSGNDLAFALFGVDIQAVNKTLDICSLFRYVHNNSPFLISAA